MYIAMKTLLYTKTALVKKNLNIDRWRDQYTDNLKVKHILCAHMIEAMIKDNLSQILTH